MKVRMVEVDFTISNKTYHEVVMYHPIHGRKPIMNSYKKLTKHVKDECERVAQMRCGTTLEFEWEA